jgi:hypothetical protein
VIQADVLRFVGGVVLVHEVGWRSPPWPPPDRMGLAVGRLSGMVRVFDPDTIEGDVIAEVKDCETIAVCVYRLRNASQLPDDIDRTRVFRGAEYVPEEVVA